MSIDANSPPLFVRLSLDIVAALRFQFVRRIDPGPPDFAKPRRVWPIVPLGLLIGLLWVGVFRATWRVFGEVGDLRLLPSVAVVVLVATFSGRLMLHAAIRLVETTGKSDQPDTERTHVGEKSLILVILVLLGLFVLVLSLQELRGWWPSNDDWRSWFNWMYPRPIYRPLLLAPLWGQWGMLVTLCAGRAAPNADALTRNYSRELSAWKLVVHSALPLFLTSVYLSRGGRFFTGPMIAAALLAATILFSTIVANLRGGQSRTTVLATGLFAQLLFLFLYRAFWPLIER
ncbi:MAG: hypothetical protein H6819_06405 [Phycisphaerales bacterium]|nr:hypothetical protein [Phycisphaerales bacterium]MCB9858547.1 hypothetical protein [Phycisphaerales bacterium]